MVNIMDRGNPLPPHRCNKGRDMCFPVCGMVHIKEPLLLTGKSSPSSDGSKFTFLLSEWSITMFATI